MKCKCGNKIGEPRVSPFPMKIKMIGEKEPLPLIYMGGFIGDKCWFCARPRS